MLASDVISKVRFFQQARRDIQGDRNLSEQGKKRQAENLEQSIQLFRQTALDAFQRAWKDERKRAGDVQQQREGAERAESKRWNYEQLNYETRSAERQLAGFASVEELTTWLSSATSTGNLERQRAVLETTPAVVLKRFSGVAGAGSLVQQLERQLNSLLSTPELLKVQQAEREGGNRVLQLIKDTQEVSDFYEPPGVWGVGNEFINLLSNVQVSTVCKVNPKDPWGAFERTTYEFMPEPAGV